MNKAEFIKTFSPGVAEWLRLSEKTLRAIVREQDIEGCEKMSKVEIVDTFSSDGIELELNEGILREILKASVSKVTIE